MEKTRYIMRKPKFRQYLSTNASLQKILEKMGRLGILLPQDSPIALLGIYPKISPPYYKYSSSSMFIASLFVIARNWKQSRCSSTEECIKKMRYIYTMGYYSDIKNKDVLNFTGKWIAIKKCLPE